MKTINDREPNYRTPSGKLHLVRCFACDPENGKENHSAFVAAGICAFCGWDYKDASNYQETVGRITASQILKESGLTEEQLRRRNHVGLVHNALMRMVSGVQIYAEACLDLRKLMKNLEKER